MSTRRGSLIHFRLRQSSSEYLFLRLEILRFPLSLGTGKVWLGLAQDSGRLSG